MNHENSKEEKQERKGKIGKDQNANEIAQIMAENMKANMENPNFESEKAILQDKVRREIIENRNKAKKDE